MITDDNTDGFSTEERQQMNNDVSELLDEWKITNDHPDYEDYLQWAEEQILKKYGGGRKPSLIIM